MKRHLLIMTAILIAVSFRGVAQINVLHDITCYGQNSGALIAIPGGWGLPPYSYQWSTGDSSQAIHNLSAGTYSVTISDDTLADSVFSVVLTQPEQIMITPVLAAPSDCDGHNNGAVNLTVSGGAFPYTYLWREINSDSTFNTQNLSNIRGGDYRIKVTDSWGCTDSAFIMVPNLWTVPVGFVIDSFVCNGLLGAVSVQADSAGPLAYYTYSWTSPYNSNSFTSNDSVFSASGNFLAGSYLITTTENATGCANYSWVTIDQTDAPLVVTESAVHNQCFGDLAGSIVLFPTGGLPLPDYHCVWSGPSGYTSTAFSIGTLASGDYSYTVTDDSACSFSGTVRIEPLMPLQGNISLTDVTCQEGPFGKANANFSGGSGVLDYAWSTGETTPSISLMTGGTYYVTVTDNRGCQRTDSIVAFEGNDICLLIPNMVTANGDGFNDVFRVEGACDMDDFLVELFTNDGDKVFSYTDCNFSWDPLSDSKTASQTVFYYYIRVSHGTRVAEYKNSLNINY